MPRKKVARFEHKSDANPPPNELPDFMEPLEPDQTPEFMRGDVGMGLEKIGAEDVVWLTPGGDGELEFRLPKQGYEQYSPVDLILLAIIRAYPKEGQRKRPDANEHERLKRARDAMFGTRKLDRGRPKRDDEILLKVAWSLHEAIFAGKGDEVKLTSLIREAAAPYYKVGELGRSDESKNRIVSRLMNHFKRRRDEFLTRATTRDDWNRGHTLKTIGEILDRLESLGVKVRREALPQMNVKGEVSAKLLPGS
jgi:hypothetical protein